MLSCSTIVDCNVKNLTPSGISLSITFMGEHNAIGMHIFFLSWRYAASYFHIDYISQNDDFQLSVNLYHSWFLLPLFDLENGCHVCLWHCMTSLWRVVAVRIIATFTFMNIGCALCERSNAELTPEITRWINVISFVSKLFWFYCTVTNGIGINIDVCVIYMHCIYFAL